MTPTELLTALRQLEKLFVDRITIVRVIVDSDGREVGRVQRVVLHRGTEPHGALRHNQQGASHDHS